MIKGKKRHILVDTLGLLLHALVTPADVQDRDGGLMLLATLFVLLAAVRIRTSTAMWRMLVVLSSFWREGAVVLAAVNDASAPLAVAFGHH